MFSKYILLNSLFSIIFFNNANALFKNSLNKSTRLDQTAYPASPYEKCSTDVLPSSIEFKTSYQSFNLYHEFIIVKGRLCFKKRGGKTWSYFGFDGLPFRTKRNGRIDPNFERPKKILTISADDDEIMALGSNRKLYLKRVHKNIRFRPIWYDNWGLVKKRPFFFTDAVSFNKGWGLGRRTIEGVGYTTAPNGRPFGGGGVSMDTIVWLGKSGREILFLDSAIPGDIHHNMCLPHRGHYTAESISYSGSTMMVIDKYGRAKTMLNDFDHMGSTYPHRYCYKCSQDKIDVLYSKSGQEINITPALGVFPLALPHEPWTGHERVIPVEKVDEDNRISTLITIDQIGRGNNERELRVYGLKDGLPGVYFKKLDQGNATIFTPNMKRSYSNKMPYYKEQVSKTDWSFRESSNLDYLLHSSKNLKWPSLKDLRTNLPEINRREGMIRNQDSSFSGKITFSKKDYPFVIKDFNKSCSPWRARIEYHGVKVSFDIHAVPMWTPFPEITLSSHHSERVLRYHGTIMPLAGEIHTKASKIFYKKYLAPLEAKTFEFVIHVDKNKISGEARHKKVSFELRSHAKKKVESSWEQLAALKVQEVKQLLPSKGKRWAKKELRFFKKYLRSIYKGIKRNSRMANLSLQGARVLKGLFIGSGARIAYKRLLKNRYQKTEISYAELVLYEIGNAVEDAPYVLKALKKGQKLKLKRSRSNYRKAIKRIKNFKRSL